MEFNIGDVIQLRNGDWYYVSGVIHDDSLVFGRKLNSNDLTEYKFKFSEVSGQWEKEIKGKDNEKSNRTL